VWAGVKKGARLAHSVANLGRSSRTDPGPKQIPLPRRGASGRIEVARDKRAWSSERFLIVDLLSRGNDADPVYLPERASAFRSE
jgi:hypothetical protein